VSDFGTGLGHHREMTDGWTSRYFSLANPRYIGPSDLPKLLRSVASKIEEMRLEPSDILDLMVSQEMTPDGPWWSATLYWSAGDEDAPADG